MRHTSNGLALICILAAIGCSSNKEVACPDIYIAPHASIDLSEPIRANGTFTMEVTADGESESCPMVVTGIGPSTEACEGDMCATSSPSTRVEMTCKKIRITGYKDDGSIPGFKLDGTPEAVSIRLVQQGRVRADQSFDLNYAPAELKGEGCAKTNHASATLTLRPLASSPEAEKPAMKAAALDPDRTYGDRIHASHPSSLVIRDDAAYDAFVSSLPKNTITKGPTKPSDDPMLKRPDVDFSKEMIVVATCGTFYCPITLAGYGVADGTLTVRVDSPGEDEETRAMAARPVGMNGGDEYGNYAAAVIPKHDGDVAFDVNSAK